MKVSQLKEFQARIQESSLKLVLLEGSLSCELILDSTLTLYKYFIHQNDLANHPTLHSFFQSINDLFEYLVKQIKDHQLTLTPSAQIIFYVRISVGLKQKVNEIKFQLIKESNIDHKQLIEEKIVELFNQLKELKSDVKNQKQIVVLLRNQIEKKEVKMNKLENEINYTKFENLKLKEEINIIFSKFDEITTENKKRIDLLGKELKRKMNLPSFVVNQLDPHFLKFEKIGNRLKKITDNAYQNIFGDEISAFGQSSYKISQVRVSNSSIMYGIGSRNLKGISNAYNHKEFLGYYGYDGTIYGSCIDKKLNGGPTHNGDLIEVKINTETWKAEWLRNGTKLVEVNIPEEMQHIQLFQLILMRDVGDEIQLV